MSLRRLFLVFGAATVAYVAGVSVIIALRVGPSARRLMADSHTAMAAWTIRNEADSSLERALDIVWRITRESETRAIRPSELDEVHGALARLVDQSWYTRWYDRLQKGSPELAVTLDSATPATDEAAS